MSFIVHEFVHSERCMIVYYSASGSSRLAYLIVPASTVRYPCTFGTLAATSHVSGAMHKERMGTLNAGHHLLETIIV